MFLNNLYDFQIAMRIYTLADKHHSLAQKQKYFPPNIFTKYFPGGVTSAVYISTDHDQSLDTGQ